jgi:hypothetical protein
MVLRAKALAFFRSLIGVSLARASLSMACKHLQLDGQTVAVPAGDVPHLAPPQDLILIDDVFEDFVEGVANVQIAVGVGGAIVEHKGLAGVGFGQDFINLVLGPKLLNLWFPPGGIGPHLEGGLGQQNGVFVDQGLRLGLNTLIRLGDWQGWVLTHHPGRDRMGVTIHRNCGTLAPALNPLQSMILMGDLLFRNLLYYLSMKFQIKPIS